MINKKLPDNDPVTITGIGGRYPQSSDINEFWNHLLAGQDLCTEDDSRWPLGYFKLPPKGGKIPDINKFDSTFFGMTFKEANDMDTQFKICHETTFEAILDAGLDPDDLGGPRTGMFIGYCYCDTRSAQGHIDPLDNDFMWTEDVSEVSKCFGFKGPCITYDSACASSFSAFNEAVHYLSSGVIDTAVVAGVAICCSPSTAAAFRRLGMTSDDGISKCLDKGAKGYVRSETIATIVLQRKSSAKRVYAQILNSKTCSDGYKKEGITFPGLETMKKLMRETYEEVNLDPKETKYIEAHVTGTQAGDPVECSAIEEVFCPEDRQDPVLLGCLKSNMGHAEGASGVAAITKACLVLQKQVIPSNMHYNEPNPNIPGLLNGKLKPVTSVTPFDSLNGIISLNSFGFGGSNIHVIIQSSEECLNENIHDLSGVNGINRLILFKSRTETGFKLLEETLRNDPSSVTTEFLALIGNVAHLNESTEKTFPYRGYFLVDSKSKMIVRSKYEDTSMTSAGINNSVNQDAASVRIVCGHPTKTWIHHSVSLMKAANISLQVSYGETSKDDEDATIIFNTLEDGVQNVKMTERTTSDEILQVIGNLFIAGPFNVNIQKLYPKVNYPVSKSTLSISPFIKWNHENDFVVYKVPNYFEWRFYNKFYTFDYAVEHNYLTGHVIDGRIIFPAAEYLFSIWKSLALELVEYSHVSYMDTGIKFTNVQLHRAIIVDASVGNGEVSFETRCNPFSGYFEIVQSGSILVTGYAMLTYDDDVPQISDFGYKTESNSVEEKLIAKKDFYKELRVRGYDYMDEFQGVDSCNFNRDGGNVTFLSNWPCFCDAVFQLILLNDDSRQLLLPTNIECLQIDIKVFKELFKAAYKSSYKNIEKSNLADILEDDNNDDGHDAEEAISSESKEFKVEIIKETREIFTRGMYIKNMLPTPAPRRKKIPNLSTFKFHFFNEVCDEAEDIFRQKEEYVKECINIIKNVGMVDESKEEEHIERGLLQTLKKMEKDTNNNFNLDDVTKYLKQNVDNVSNDMLLKIPIESDSFQHQVFMMYETFSNKSLKITEVNLSSKSCLGRNTFEKMSTEVNYSLFTDVIIGKDGQEDAKSIDDFLNKKLDSHIVTIQHPSLGFNFLTQNDKSNEQFIEIVEHALNQMTEGSFIQIIARNKSNEVENILSEADDKDILEGIKNILSKTGKSKLVSMKQVGSLFSILCRKLDGNNEKRYKTFEIETFNYNWVDSIKHEIYIEEKHDEEVTKKPIDNDPIYLIAKDNDCNGLSGLIKCLRKEDERFRGILIADQVDDSKLNDIINECINLDLSMVIYKDGRFGTNLGLYWKGDDKVLKDEKTDENVSFVLDVDTKGDLSSLKYYKKKIASKSLETTFNIHYSALNFKDVMVASGRVPLHSYPESFHNLGMEFSGINSVSGKRVMGFCSADALATKIDVGELSDFMFDVPDGMSLEEAATIPVVYSTVYYALIMRGKLLPGESILIHAGSGGVGQAAINVCQSMGCQVYTTVGTKEKREFIKSQFNISDDHIFDSRSVSFSDDILRATDGNGVDVVLNSLSDEKLQVGLTCLAENGRFIEIGKYDMAMNSFFDPSCLSRNQTFQSVCLAFFMSKAADKSNKCSMSEIKKFKTLVDDGLKSGVVKPLSRHVFEMNQPEEAFRFMATGKHIGKVLMRMKYEKEEDIQSFAVRPTKRKVQFDCDKTYLLIGGLGGLGLEICHWLVTKGARHIIITSRSGISSVYHEFFIQRLETCFGATIKVSKLDVSKYDEARELIEDGCKMGPIGGIINLAMVLKDALFENQTKEMFQECCSIKIKGTSNLDTLSRQLCPQLDHFICFSSLVSIFGNAGQSNYAYANTFMDNLCVSRREAGVPGLSIVWGVVGDVGHVAEKMGNDVSVAGLAPQRINSCLDVFETFLFGNNPCVGSCIDVENSSDIGKGGNMLSTILNVLGIKDHSKVDPKSSLGDLGLDSLMAVEIKQVLEKKYDKVLSTKEIHALTIEEIKTMQSAEDNKLSSSLSAEEAKNVVAKEAAEKIMKSFETSTKLFVELNDIKEGNPIFVFPPIDGTFDSMINVLNEVTTKTRRPLIGVNWIKDNDKHETIEEMSKYYLEHILLSFPNISSFNFVTYSFGSLIATQITITIMNESKYSGLKVSKLVILDFSPEYGRQGLNGKISNFWDENVLNSSLAKHIVSYSKAEKLGYEKEMKEMPKDDFFQKRFDILNSQTNNKITEQMFLDLCNKMRRKAKMMDQFNPRGTINKSLKVLLVKSSTQLTIDDGKIDDLNEYFGLNQFIESIDVITFNGSHVTFLQDNYVAISDEITKYISN